MFVFPRLVQFFISPVYPHHHVVIHCLLEMVNLLYVINLLSDLCLIICCFAMLKVCRLALRQTSASFFFNFKVVDFAKRLYPFKKLQCNLHILVFPVATKSIHSIATFVCAKINCLSSAEIVC